MLPATTTIKEAVTVEESVVVNVTEMLLLTLFAASNKEECMVRFAVDAPLIKLLVSSRTKEESLHSNVPRVFAGK